jgi:hypothetical protein
MQKSLDEGTPDAGTSGAKKHDECDDGRVNHQSHDSTNGSAAQGPNTAERLAVEFLEQLRPKGPWVLTAILPDGPIETTTAHSASEVVAFVIKCNGIRNLYYSVNPTRGAVVKKAAKTDIAAIEYLLADLDPKAGENSVEAKARYLKLLETFESKPTAIVDSGNGIQCLWRLSERIVLGAPTKTMDGKLAFGPEDLAKIKDAEARTAAIMEQRLDAKAGTQNVDRILRLPGTTNLPNAKKAKDGREKCRTGLLWFNNGTSYALNAFPLPEPTGPGLLRMADTMKR